MKVESETVFLELKLSSLTVTPFLIFGGIYDSFLNTFHSFFQYFALLCQTYFDKNVVKMVFSSLRRYAILKYISLLVSKRSALDHLQDELFCVIMRNKRDLTLGTLI